MTNEEKRAKVEQSVREAIPEVWGIEDYTLESDLMKDLGVDSLDVVLMQMEMEDKFNCEIPDDELLKLRTVKDMIDMVSKYV